MLRGDARNQWREGVPMFIRGGLITLVVVQAPIGLWALFAPHSFYDEFPLGRGGWVSALGPYNEHMTVDYGSLTLALVVVLVAAAIAMERTLVLVAAGAYLMWSLPHFVYHMITLGHYGIEDAIGNAITLAFTVALPLAILLKALRTTTGSPASPRPAA
jgi:hypothetical protein